MGSHYKAYLVPMTAAYIHRMNLLTDHKINLKGIGIGDGWINPGIQFISMIK